MNWTRWLVVLCVLGASSTACRKKQPPPPKPRKRVVKRRPVAKTQLPRGVKIRPEEVLLHAGSFLIGSDDGTTPGAKAEAPSHKVSLRYVFAMWRYEVTQEEFRALMGYNPSHFKKCGKECPVENVNWHEAAYFANRLSQKHGLSTCFRCNGKRRNAICQAHPYFQGKRYYQCNGYRLPTEAEWEYAARAGSQGLYYKVPPQPDKMVATLDRIAWYGKNSQVDYKGGFRCPLSLQGKKQMCGPHKVGAREPNKWGLHDMIGNVSEWVYDRFGPYTRMKLVDPVGAKSGRRVFRGCNWFHRPRECRVTRRFRSSPSLRNNLIGLRPVRTLVLSHQEKAKPKPKPSK